MKSRRLTHLIILCIFAVFFFGILIAFGVPVYNDSDQYMVMHVRREPLYPVFLFLIRSVFGSGYLTAVGIVQTIICIAASYAFTVYLSDRFSMKPLFEVILAFIVMMPYIVTPFASTMHVMLSTGIMSESLALPLFLIFFVLMHKAVTDRSIKYLIFGFILALMISLIRSNLTVLLAVWLVLAVVVCAQARRFAYIALFLAMFVLAFPARDLATKSYNLAFNGRFVGNQYGNVTLLTNIFYATDQKTLALVKDERLNMTANLQYYVMDQNGWTYAYAGDSALDRAVYLEEVHDSIKYEILEYGFRDINDYYGITDYIEYNGLAEQSAGELIRILWPKCFGRWFADYVMLALRGVVRSVAVINPLMCVYAALVIIGAAVCAVILLRRDMTSPAGWMAVISILLILANAFGTAVLIMCLSRYMVYGIPVFYASVLCMGIEIYNKHRSVV